MLASEWGNAVKTLQSIIPQFFYQYKSQIQNSLWLLLLVTTPAASNLLLRPTTNITTPIIVTKTTIIFESSLSTFLALHTSVWCRKYHITCSLKLSQGTNCLPFVASTRHTICYILVWQIVLSSAVIHNRLQRKALAQTCIPTRDVTLCGHYYL